MIHFVQDIFAEKILVSPLTVCFPAYQGENRFDDAAAYIRDQFQLLNNASKSEIHTNKWPSYLVRMLIILTLFKK